MFVLPRRLAKILLLPGLLGNLAMAFMLHNGQLAHTSCQKHWSRINKCDDYGQHGCATTLDKESRMCMRLLHSGSSPRSLTHILQSSRYSDTEDIQPMVLTEENVEAVLVDCRAALGTLFGYLPENRGVGITGEVDFVDLEGPTVVVKLQGRFWHPRQLVIDRIASFIQARIPECVEVIPSDPSQLDDADPKGERDIGELM